MAGATGPKGKEHGRSAPRGQKQGPPHGDSAPDRRSSRGDKKNGDNLSTSLEMYWVTAASVPPPKVPPRRWCFRPPRACRCAPPLEWDAPTAQFRLSPFPSGRAQRAAARLLFPACEVIPASPSEGRNGASYPLGGATWPASSLAASSCLFNLTPLHSPEPCGDPLGVASSASEAIFTGVFLWTITPKRLSSPTPLRGPCRGGWTVRPPSPAKLKIQLSENPARGQRRTT